MERKINKGTKFCPQCEAIAEQHFALVDGYEAAQPQYREPTIEDAVELRTKYIRSSTSFDLNEEMLVALNQCGFVRKVQA